MLHRSQVFFFPNLSNYVVNSFDLSTERVLWLRVELDIAVNGLPMGKCPGVKASASLTSSDGVTSVVLNCGLPQFKSELSGTDEVVVAFSQLFGRKVVSTISLPLLIILRSVAL